MKKKTFLTLLPLFIVAALCMTLTSCGGGDDDGGSPPETPPSTSGTEDQNGGDQDGQQLGNPLTLEAIGNGTITFKNRAVGPVSYRIDNGNVQKISAGADGQIPVSAGQKVAFYGDNATYNDEVNNVYSNISSTAEFYAYGNMMSLIKSTGYESAKVLSGDYTFHGLFENSVNLKNHPSRRLLLPATTLTKGCYSGLFFNCSGLTKAPSLPAMDLTEECYFAMFSGCTSLTSSPELVAETLAKGCYFMMFNGCTNLDFVMCYATDNSASLCTYQWLNGVSSTGVFVMSEDMSSWTRGTSGIPSEWEVQNVYGEPTYSDINSTPLTLEAIADGTITFQNKAAGSVIYKIDGSEESQTIKTNTTKTIYVTAGQKVRFFGDNSAYYNDVFSYSNISSTTDFYVYGNIMSLVNSKNYANTIKLTKEYTFAYLFEGSIHLRNHPSHQLVLPATTLTQYCYFRMFNGCTSLTTPSVLPANKLAPHCYHFMYSFCTNLNTAPELPATTLAENCYWGMFYGCKSLTTAPELPATTLAKGCYRQMFDDCTSLTTAPELFATTLAESCYYCMFKGCSALTTAPELPATTLTRECYYEMFNGCTSLKYVKCLATNKSATDCTQDWLKDTSSSGTFVKKSGISWTSGSSGIPTGGTVISE